MKQKQWVETHKKLPETFENLPSTFSVKLEPQPDNGTFLVTSPEIPALLTEAKTPYDALRSAADALQLINAVHGEVGSRAEVTKPKRSSGRCA